MKKPKPLSAYRFRYRGNSFWVPAVEHIEIVRTSKRKISKAALVDLERRVPTAERQLLRVFAEDSKGEK